MSNKNTALWKIHPSRPYFFYDPEGDGFAYFATEQERNDYADNAIQEYLDDGWSEDVVFAIAGKLTHRATQTDFVRRPSDDAIDEDGIDENGIHWDSDWTSICNYKLLPIKETKDE